MSASLKHLSGLLLFLSIIFLTLCAESADRIPYIESQWPVRIVVEAEQEVRLYNCEDFGGREPVGLLKPGETADLEMVVCGPDTHWGVKLPDGKTACYSARDADRVGRRKLKFYYF